MMHKKIGMMGWLATALCVALIVAAPGCSLSGELFATQADTMRGLAADIVGRLADGGAGQVSVAGQGLNPKYVAEVAVVYRASAGMEGIAGSYSVGASGQLSDRKMDDAVLRIIQAQDITAAEKRLLLRDLLIPAAPAPSAEEGGEAGAAPTPSPAPPT